MIRHKHITFNSKIFINTAYSWYKKKNVFICFKKCLKSDWLILQLLLYYTVEKKNSLIS